MGQRGCWKTVVALLIGSRGSKQQHGLGWSIPEKRHQAHLTHCFDDRTCRSVTLDCAWDFNATPEVLTPRADPWRKVHRGR